MHPSMTTDLAPPGPPQRLADAQLQREQPRAPITRRRSTRAHPPEPATPAPDAACSPPPAAELSAACADGTRAGPDGRRLRAALRGCGPQTRPPRRSSLDGPRRPGRWPTWNHAAWSPLKPTRPSRPPHAGEDCPDEPSDQPTAPFMGRRFRAGVRTTAERLALGRPPRPPRPSSCSGAAGLASPASRGSQRGPRRGLAAWVASTVPAPPARRAAPQTAAPDRDRPPDLTGRTVGWRRDDTDDERQLQRRPHRVDRLRDDRAPT